MKRLSHREDINLATKYYSSLFQLPSLKLLLLFIYLVSTLFGSLISLFISSLQNPLAQIVEGILVKSILFGSLFFIITLFADYMTTKLLFKQDVILSNFRRVIFLSIISFILLAVFVMGSLFLKYFCIRVYAKVLSLGLFATISFRLLIIDTASTTGKISRLISGALQPTLLLLLSTILVAIFGQEELYPTSLIYPPSLALIFSVLGVWIFKRSLDVEGRKMIGIPSIEVARAFIINWTEDVKEPLEEILERISEERSVSISALIFKVKNTNRLKAIIVVPNIHAGPFKNIGSSPLPSMIKESLEKEFQCIVSVPHGISGHELDLPSQVECEKVIKELVNSLKKPCSFSERATRFFMVEKDGAKVGCQVFKDCVLMTLTTSPETMEDLPPELYDTIVKGALENGFSWAIIIDSHNSINGPPNMERSLAILSEAAYLALDKAKYFLNDNVSSNIKVGVGKLIPKDLGLKEGIGPGGITAIVVNIDGQRVAYITIDGNNMVSGLREKISLSLRESGIDGGEIFTTDTHTVNAIVLNKRGYHPVGEAISHERIIDDIKKIVHDALRNEEPVEFAWLNINAQEIKVIGEKQISALSLLTDKAFKKAKKNSIIFTILGTLLAILFVKI
ncbi:MAG: DUF2070 family protein [Candidatus Bathyarchaeia archaeon]